MGIVVYTEPKRHQVRDVCCGCKMMIYVTLDMNGMMWHVATFVEKHNLGVNRVITPLSRVLFQSLKASNISPMINITW